MKDKDTEEKANHKALAKRHYVKYLTTRFVLALIQTNPKSSLIKSYRNSYYCCHEMEVNETNELISHYCKNRWCFTCNRIRTAVCINNYEAILMGFQQPYFVTLTAPTVVGGDLKARIQLFEKEWRKITDIARKNLSYFKGLRKMECTLRPYNRYHYHYHIIIEGKEQAEWLMTQWLKRIKGAGRQAQDLKPADGGCMLELFKYFTKMVDKKERVLTQFKRLDFLFTTLRGKRVFQPFGGVKPLVKEADEDFTNDLKAKLKRPFGLDGNLWSWHMKSYISEFGEILQDYNPSPATLKLLSRTPKQKGED